MLVASVWRDATSASVVKRISSPEGSFCTIPSENVFAICILELIVDFSVDASIDAVSVVILLVAVAIASVND